MNNSSRETFYFQSLRDILNISPNHCLSEETIKDLLYQTLLQLKWLHDHGEVHGTITLDTIGLHDNQIRLLKSEKLDGIGSNISNKTQDIIALGNVAIALLTGTASNLDHLHQAWESDCLVSDQFADIINYMIGRHGDQATTVDQIFPYFSLESLTTSTAADSTQNLYFPNSDYATEVNHLPTAQQRRSTSRLNIRLVSIFGASLMAVVITFGVFKIFNTRTNNIENHQAEAISYLQSISQAQIDIFNQENKISIEIRDLNIAPIADDSYRIFPLNEATILTTATAQQKGLKSYALVTFIAENLDNQLSMQSIICQTAKSSEIPPQLPSLEETTIACPDGSELVNSENSPDGMTHFIQTGKILTALPQQLPLSDNPSLNPSPPPFNPPNSPIVRTQRVQFTPGTTGTTLQGTTVTNRLDNFLLQLGKGQQMTVSIAQGNIFATVYDPSESLIGQASNQTLQWRGLLPRDGDYTLEISGSDNSSYLVGIDVITIPQTEPRGISQNGVAIVFDPPSNVRDSPNGEILCSVQTQQTINIYGSSGDWYRTDVCGTTGFIHNSQLRF